MKGAAERLRHILEAIAKIEQYASRGRSAFERDELIQTWVVHHIEIIGEACRSLPQDFREQHPDVPWPDIIGMRNVLVHEYFGIDRGAVWTVVERDLPILKQKIKALLAEDGGTEA
jgi:uncharacterized protein with HEPN domain